VGGSQRRSGGGGRRRCQGLLVPPTAAHRYLEDMPRVPVPREARGGWGGKDSARGLCEACRCLHNLQTVYDGGIKCRGGLWAPSMTPPSPPVVAGAVRQDPNSLAAGFPWLLQV